jgi:hypothetical protein
MNILTRSIVIILLACMTGCSDGSQVSQRIIGTISERNDDKDKNNDVHFLSVEFEGDLTTYKIDSDSNNIRTILSDQFLMMGDLSVNLVGVKTIQVKNDTLSVKF